MNRLNGVLLLIFLSFFVGESFVIYDKYKSDKVNLTACGFYQENGILLNQAIDNQASFGEFPWIVAILYYHPHDGKRLKISHCAGTIIHDRVVLTAAHCVNGNKQKYIIQAGDWKHTSKIEPYHFVNRRVKTIISHPLYEEENYSNDIAVLILKKRLPLMLHIRPICLPNPASLRGSGNCYVSGWGKNTTGPNGLYSTILKKSPLNLVERDECQLAYPKGSPEGTFVCARGEIGKDSCDVDDGGPLMCQIDPLLSPIPTQQVIGIVSHVGCKQNGGPGLYTNVTHYRDWVQTVLKREKIIL